MGKKFQYTDITENRNKIHITCYNNETGNKEYFVTENIKDLSLYTINRTYDETGYNSFIGNVPLNKKEFNTIEEYKKFISDHEEYEGYDVYGDFSLERKWINSYYKVEINPKMEHINIGFFDIETEVVVGQKVDANGAPNRITSMVLYASKSNTYYIFADKEVSKSYFSEDELNESNFEWYYFTPDIVGEYKMLKTFAHIVNKIEKLDVLSAYFGDLFDYPYIYNRMLRIKEQQDFYPELQGEKIDVKSLSPLNIAYKTQRGNIYVKGIAYLDYFELYKKYTYSSPESWKLDFIANKELGVGKVQLGDFMDVYHNDYPKYIYYNYIDVKRLVQLDAKLNFMNLHLELSYLAKQNFEDTFSPVRTWESILYSFFNDKGIVFNPVKYNEKKKYLGAYTHEPTPGFYNYPMSFDLNSLYPHLIMQYYISPETIISNEELTKMFPNNETLKKLLELRYDLELVSNEYPYDKVKVAKAYDKVGDMLINKEFDLSFLHEKNITMTPSLEFFKKDDDAVLPYFMGHFYDMRKIIKKRMLVTENQIENLKLKKEINNKELETLKSDYEELKKLSELGDIILTLESLAKRLHLKQMAMKILLNSAYGAFGNAYFRFFDIRLAKGITSGGRLAIRSLLKALENGLREVYEEFTGKEYQGTPFFIYSDTDSCVGESELNVDIDGVNSTITIEDLYLKVGGDKTKNKEIIDISDKNIKSMSFNYDTETPEMKNTKYIWRHKVKKKMYKIKTKDKEVIITEDHSVIIYRNGEYKSIKPSEIIKTDKIVKIISKN